MFTIIRIRDPYSGSDFSYDVRREIYYAQNKEELEDIVSEIFIDDKMLMQNIKDKTGFCDFGEMGCAVLYKGNHIYTSQFMSFCDYSASTQTDHAYTQSYDYIDLVKIENNIYHNVKTALSFIANYRKSEEDLKKLIYENKRELDERKRELSTLKKLVQKYKDDMGDILNGDA